MWRTDKETLATCFIEKQGIHKPGFTISSRRDENITGIWFDQNQHIKYLPENVADRFPNLIGFSAESCGIKSISRENFKGLTELKHLWLKENMLEMIPTNTFSDLVSLEKLHLCKSVLHFGKSDFN